MTDFALAALVVWFWVGVGFAGLMVACAIAVAVTHGYQRRTFRGDAARYLADVANEHPRPDEIDDGSHMYNPHLHGD